MNTLIRLMAVGTALSLTAACTEGLDDTDTDTDVGVDCMEDLDGDGTPDIYPASGPLSQGDYEGCDVYTGPTFLSYFPKPACSGGEWDYTFETRGWASGGVLYTLDTAGGNDNTDFWWGERHDLADGESHPNEWWDAYGLTLPVVTDFNNQVDGTNSFHGCDTNDDATLLWGVEIYDYTNTNEVVDCVIISPSETTDAWLGDFTTEYPDFSDCDSFRWTPQ